MPDNQRSVTVGFRCSKEEYNCLQEIALKDNKKIAQVCYDILFNKYPESWELSNKVSDLDRRIGDVEKEIKFIKKGIEMLLEYTAQSLVTIEQIAQARMSEEDYEKVNKIIELRMKGIRITKNE